MLKSWNVVYVWTVVIRCAKSCITNFLKAHLAYKKLREEYMHIVLL